MGNVSLLPNSAEAGSWGSGNQVDRAPSMTGQNASLQPEERPDS